MTLAISRRALCAGLAVPFFVDRARAQGVWPDRLITLMHGFGPGGNADVTARVIAEQLSARLGQQVVVEGRTGAGGTLAAAQAARAAPDGNTLIVLPGGHAVSAVLYKKLPYHSVNDFSMIGMMTEFPFILAAHPEGEIKSVADILRIAKARGAPLNYATAGNGTGQHLSGALFGAMAKINVQHIAYRGSSPLIADLMGKRLDFIVETPTSILELIRNGQLRAVAVTGATRFFGLPDVPTVAEGGVAGYATSSWLGLAAPAGVAPAIVTRLNNELNATLKDPAVVERFKGLGNETRPGTPEGFRARIAADIEKWTAAVDAAGIERI